MQCDAQVATVLDIYDFATTLIQNPTHMQALDHCYHLQTVAYSSAPTIVPRPTRDLYEWVSFGAYSIDVLFENVTLETPSAEFEHFQAYFHDITKLKRDLSKRFHPDRCGTNEAIQALNSVIDILKESRAQYNFHYMTTCSSIPEYVRFQLHLTLHSEYFREKVKSDQLKAEAAAQAEADDRAAALHQKRLTNSALLQKQIERRSQIERKSHRYLPNRTDNASRRVINTRRAFEQLERLRRVFDDLGIDYVICAVDCKVPKKMRGRLGKAAAGLVCVSDIGRRVLGGCCMGGGGVRVGGECDVAEFDERELLTRIRHTAYTYCSAELDCPTPPMQVA